VKTQQERFKVLALKIAMRQPSAKASQQPQEQEAAKKRLFSRSSRERTTLITPQSWPSKNDLDFGV
jgi:hypothetical protein